MRERYWESVRLDQMTAAEWEGLCDGCGLCCVHLLADDDNQIYQTDVVCDLMDLESCQCTQYSRRQQLVPECNKVSLDLPEAFPTMPETCAYRRLYYDQPIPPWHPLITGSTDAMHQGGHSARGKVIHEREAGDLEDHVVAWTPVRFVDLSSSYSNTD